MVLLSPQNLWKFLTAEIKISVVNVEHKNDGGEILNACSSCNIIIGWESI